MPWAGVTLLGLGLARLAPPIPAWRARPRRCARARLRGPPQPRGLPDPPAGADRGAYGRRSMLSGYSERLSVEAYRGPAVRPASKPAARSTPATAPAPAWCATPPPPAWPGAWARARSEKRTAAESARSWRLAGRRRGRTAIRPDGSRRNAKPRASGAGRLVAAREKRGVTSGAAQGTRPIVRPPVPEPRSPCPSPPARLSASALAQAEAQVAGWTADYAPLPGIPG